MNFTPARHAIIDAHLDAVIERLVDERYRFRYLSATAADGKEIPGAFSTACWRWIEKGEAHRQITFGEKLAERLVRPSVDRLCAYALAYYFHERAHAFHTERDLRKLNAAAARDGVSFRLINLLEDARIEAADRVHRKARFDWLEFEDAIAGADPASYFLALIQAEGTFALALCDAKAGTTFLPAHAERVRDHYYPKAVAAKDTWEILELAKEWRNEFGEPPEGTGLGDMDASLLAATYPAVETAVDAAVSDLNPSREKEKKDDPGTVAEVGESAEVKEFSNGDFLTGEQTVDSSEADALAAHADRAFPRTVAHDYSSSPSKRLSMRRALRDSERIYARRVPGQNYGTVRVVFMLDCSASMRRFAPKSKRTAHGEGCLLLATLSRLARSGRIAGHVILTAGNESGAAERQTFALPMKDEAIRRIRSDGAFEGFDAAMSAAEALIRRADLVLAYTDAAITDEPVEKERWHKMGVHSIGLFCGDGDIGAALAEWFDAAIARETLPAIVDALAQVIARWAKARTR